MSPLFQSSLIAVSLAAALPATALTFECQFQEKARTISVVYPEQTPTPCEVQYTKDGNTEVLWQANNTEGYCEEKARAFVAKHEGWGWQCASQHITPQAAPEESADSPAE